jgi:N6-L-threonylcarbamoyladenine synthase
MSLFLGIDTSNYTTSVALCDGTGRVLQNKRLLPVKSGERGLRQSDAVFHHTKAYPELLAELFDNIDEKIEAVGVSVSPTTEKGSYMPCFLVGESFASSLSWHGTFGTLRHRSRAFHEIRYSHTSAFAGIAA